MLPHTNLDWDREGEGIAMNKPRGCSAALTPFPELGLLRALSTQPQAYLVFLPSGRAAGLLLCLLLLLQDICFYHGHCATTVSRVARQAPAGGEAWRLVALLCCAMAPSPLSLTHLLTPPTSYPFFLPCRNLGMGLPSARTERTQSASLPPPGAGGGGLAGVGAAGVAADDAGAAGGGGAGPGPAAVVGELPVVAVLGAAAKVDADAVKQEALQALEAAAPRALEAPTVMVEQQQQHLLQQHHHQRQQLAAALAPAAGSAAEGVKGAIAAAVGAALQAAALSRAIAAGTGAGLAPAAVQAATPPPISQQPSAAAAAASAAVAEPMKSSLTAPQPAAAVADRAGSTGEAGADQACAAPAADATVASEQTTAIVPAPPIPELAAGVKAEGSGATTAS